jgi:hypothetical protein
VRHWPIPLHTAIQIVLWDAPARTASTQFISDQVNARRLYIQKAGGPVFPEQIFLRAKNYSKLFQFDGRETIIGR